MKKEILMLRNAMKKHNIDAYIVPTGDFHGSEYIHNYFKGRSYLSGFTGSAGTLVVTQQDALLWTDGRYFLQGEIQLKGTGITLMKSGLSNVPTITDFLKSMLKKGQTIGFDGRIVPYETGYEYETLATKFGFNIVYTEDLLSDFWSCRPVLLGNELWELPLSSAGSSFDEKLAQVREAMKSHDADYYLVCSLEENAWLYNLRGSDVLYTPVFLSFTLISHTAVNLYAYEPALSNINLAESVTLNPYIKDNDLAIFETLRALPKDAKVIADSSSCSYFIWKILQEKQVISVSSPISMLKAVKNPSEIKASQEVHIEDGAAMVKFIYWLKVNIDKMQLTEITASNYLEERRREIKDFVELSFDTISGYGPNGAIIHYSATEESNATLKPEGFLLVDSGGQYLRGTTDITRTISLGPLSQKMRECYTAVLKANINLAMHTFEPDTSGMYLDSIARKPIHDIGYDYNHGTGHGVGHVLCVHEGPNVINKRNNNCNIVPGTITTDEPGIYIEGEFGIRLENELLCVKSNTDDKYSFEPLTLCPFDRNAIIKDMLSEDELTYLNIYHKKVFDQLSPLLTNEEKEFLYNETAAL